MAAFNVELRLSPFHAFFVAESFCSIAFLLFSAFGVPVPILRQPSCRQC